MSIDGTYQVSVQVGGKLHTATAALSTLDDMLFVTATDVPMVGEVQASGTAYSDDTFSVSGTLRVLLVNLKYSIRGRVEGDVLSATCETNKGTFSAAGTRVAD